jgi:hypothetical protein
MQYKSTLKKVNHLAQLSNRSMRYLLLSVLFNIDGIDHLINVGNCHLLLLEMKYGGLNRVIFFLQGWCC